MKLTLFNYFRSSSSWRVRIALAYKAAEYTYAPVSLLDGEQYSDAHLARNPQGMVPYLEIQSEDGKKRGISQSLAIIEWLEETFPNPPLLPRDAYARARARQLAEIVNSSIQPFQNLSVLRRIKGDYGGDEQAFARGFIERGLAAYQAALPGRHTFSAADTPTIADCCLVPQLGHARRFGADLAPLGRLVEIEAACAALPAFAAAHPDKQPDAPPA